MVSIPRKWDDKFVYEYITKCILQDKGIPMFIKQVFGAKFPKGMVILACRDLDNQDLLPSYFLIGVPQEIEEILEKYPTEEKSEWKAVYEYLAQKLMSAAEKRYEYYKEKYPVVSIE